MLNLKTLSDSGLIEAYCLGQLQGKDLKNFVGLLAKNPEIEREVRKVQLQFSSRPLAEAPPVCETTKSELFSKIRNLEFQQRLEGYNHELIDSDSCHEHWKAKVSRFEFPTQKEPIHLIPIREEEKVKQYLAWVGSEVPEEVHDNMVESFLVLNGTCECRLENEKLELRAGDFLEIPIHTTHQVKVTSHEGIFAILQRIYL